jgi:acyl-CoA thioester hydrolase
VRYLRELHAGERVTIDVRLIDADEKRLHWWQELHSMDGDFLSATCEIMTVHVDLRIRKATSFPPDMLARIEAWRREEADWPAPRGLGRNVGIKRPAPDMQP